jgi:ribose 5-phosphate isomerase B
LRDEGRRKDRIIGIGADDAAFGLKQRLVEYLEERGYEVKDYGCYSEDPVDYPDVAVEVAEVVARGEHDRAILCCGRGL